MIARAPHRSTGSAAGQNKRFQIPNGRAAHRMENAYRSSEAMDSNAYARPRLGEGLAQ